MGSPQAVNLLFAIGSRQEEKQNTEKKLKELQRKYDQLQKQYETLQQENQKFIEENNNLKIQITSLEANLRILAIEKDELQSKVKDLQFQIDQLKKAAEESTAQEKLRKQQYADINNRMDKLQAENNVKQKEMNDLKNKVTILDSANAGLQEELDDNENQLKNLRTALISTANQRQGAIQDLQNYGVDGVQVLFRKLANSFQGEILNTVIGGVGNYGIYNLKRLQQFMQSDSPTPEEKIKWNQLLQKIPAIKDDTVSETIKWLVVGGNEAAHKLKKEDLDNALKAIQYFPPTVQPNLKTLLVAASNLV